MNGPEISDFQTKQLPSWRDAIAPDGSDIRFLLTLKGGGIAHFQFPPGMISIPVAHRTVEEIWFFLSGRGLIWRKRKNREAVTPVEPGVCITIPVRTHFQLHSLGPDPLAAIGVTMPPWPGEGEAYKVRGKWVPTGRTEF